MKQDRIYLEHILDSIKQIEIYCANFKEVDDFFDDRKTQDAVVRNIEIIGEASAKLSKNLRDKHKEIQWRQIIDTRNLLIHGYFGISYLTVWNIVKKHIPQLRKQIKKIISDIKKSENL